MAKDQDKHLEDYLSGKDGVSTLYAQRQADEPSALVDKTILRAAHAAVPRKTSGIGPFSGSWQIPVALAAVLVLAVGITMNLEKPGGDEAQQLERYSPTTSASEPAAAKKKVSGKPEQVPQTENAHTGSIAADAQENETSPCH